MKVFHCGNCGQLVFFENIQCVKCGYRLAYLPDEGVITPLTQDKDGTWSFPSGDDTPKYRLCQNNAVENVCTWAVPVEDPNPLCVSCRLTRVIPNLNVPGNREAWAKLEAAKRRAVYTLICMHLPIKPKVEDDDTGLAFEFLADGEEPVLTGHDEGVITLNIAEADDAERERRRTQMHEPYRTLLGHFRHELAHYYWDRLIPDTKFHKPFRKLFGDESIDYAESLKKHYETGPSPDWQEQFVSSYASVHPWEDWAETWAHYMHITDTTEMAVECGLELKPWRKDEPSMKPTFPIIDGQPTSFEKMMRNWFALSYVLNNLNRCLGQVDSYPFIVTEPVVQKLKFIHEVIAW